jgi:hypothetical protein
MFVCIEAVTGYQCQALKYPSGKIECVYVTVPVNKEGELRRRS